jgi:error-prone DNA polymerase
MVKNEYAREFAERCFRQIEGFGEYGFPESHAAAFALLAYVSSWIKCRHPDVFACALLNSQPMGFYAPAQIVRDFRNHCGEAREVDINHSFWDCALEPCAAVPLKNQDDAAELRYALRLGFRQVKGLSTDDAKAITEVRGLGYMTLDEFAARTGLPVHKLKILAEADAFRSIGLDRRQALWAVSRYAETGTPAVMLEGLPLFAATNSSPLAREAEIKLPTIKLGEHVLADYIAIRMSLKAHPMALLRPVFQKRNYLRAARLRELTTGRLIQVAGIVSSGSSPAQPPASSSPPSKMKPASPTSSSGQRSSRNTGASCSARGCWACAANYRASKA